MPRLPSLAHRSTLLIIALIAFILGPGSAPASVSAKAAVPAVPLTCGAGPIPKWTTASASFQVINSCTLVVPSGGTAYIYASASLGLELSSQPYEGRFRLAVDGVNLDPIDRWVNVYTDSGDGSDVSLGMSTLQAVGPGTHTFSLVGMQWKGPGTVAVYRPTLHVVFFPSSAQTLLCTGATVDSWSTSAAGFQVIRSCTLNLPTRGTVYIDANASVSLVSGGAAYEGSFRIGVDGAYLPSSERRVNIYPDSGDGSDAALATSTVQALNPGLHTFSLAGRLYSGSGPLQVYRPSINAIFIPEWTRIQAAVSPALDSWSTGSFNFAPSAALTLKLPYPATVFVQASASLALAPLDPQPYEALFQIRVDENGASESNRWVNVYTDSGDGTDKSLATSLLKALPAGTHTFTLDARLYNGAGPLQLYNPVVSVLILYDPPIIYLPRVAR